MTGKAGDRLLVAVSAVSGYVKTVIGIIAHDIGSADATHHGGDIIVTADTPSLLVDLKDSHVAGTGIIDLLIDTGVPVVFCTDSGIINAVIDASRTVTFIADIGLGKVDIQIAVAVGSRYKIREVISIVTGVA
jgi:hypothetical protein